MWKIFTAAGATIVILDVNIQKVIVVNEFRMTCWSQSLKHEHLLRRSLNHLVGEESSLLFLHGVDRVMNGGKVQLRKPFERFWLMRLNCSVIWVLQNVESPGFAVIVEVISSLQGKLLLDLKFNFFDIEITLRVVDDNACLSYLIVVENILVELDIQGSFTLFASTVSRDFSFPFTSATCDEFHWGFVYNDHALVLHLIVAVVAQIGDDFVGHFCLAFEMVLMLVEMHGGWKTIWENKIEVYGIITRLETSIRELIYRLLEI